MKQQFLRVTKAHVLEAAKHLKSGRKTRWGNSRKFLLMHEGVGLPPKAVLGLATCIANGIDEEAVRNFTGGEETNSVLRSLGFEIVTRE
jgi:hypothetical protein